jgi:hypothetical protein
MEPFDPVPLPSRPSPFYKLKSIAFSKEAGSSSLSAAGSNILRPAQKQASIEDDPDGEMSIAALQAKKERLLADRERLSAALSRYKEKYEIEHKMRLDSEKMAEDCVRRSKMTENQLKAHREDIQDLQYHSRAVRSLALAERAELSKASRGTVSETLPSGAAGSTSDDARSGAKHSKDPALSGGVSPGMKLAKSPATTVAESEPQKAEILPEPSTSPVPSGRKSQRADALDTGGKTLSAVQSLENLLHEVSNCANTVDAMDEEKSMANPDWEDGADIEILSKSQGLLTPVVRLKHPSGNEAVVHLRTGLFWRWATSDGRVLVGGLPQIWPDVIPYEGQVWSLEADALKDDQDEPSVTLTYVCDARQCRVQMTLSACARGLRQRITVENLGTHNLVFQVAARASEANTIDHPPAEMFPPGDTLLDARCLDPMPSSPALIAPSGCWAAMRRWTDRDTTQVGR